jgi:hypothetical protein
MRDRIATGIGVGAVFLAMLCPMLLLPGDGDRIEEFLALRTRVLTALNNAPPAQHAGVRRVTRRGREWDPCYFDDLEIERVIRSRGWWRQQSQQVTWLLPDPVSGSTALAVADNLLKLESAGLARAGLLMLTSASAPLKTDVQSCVAFQVWSDPRHDLTVIVQATVPDRAREGHVSKYLIEQFAIRR